MSEDEIPTDYEVGGDTYALRTFAVRSGRLTSIAQGGGHWVNGRCLAICLANPDDPDHVVPSESCSCGVYGFWTAKELLDQYEDHSKQIVTVIRMEGACIEGDKGVRTNAAEIVAWWVADCEDTTKLVAACEASAPGTRRFYDRDVMVGLYPTGMRD